MEDGNEPLRKASSVSSDLAMQIKTEHTSSKNSRKYQNRRFRPKFAEQKDNTEMADETKVVWKLWTKW